MAKIAITISKSPSHSILSSVSIEIHLRSFMLEEAHRNNYALHSAGTGHLVMLPIRLSTVANRAFLVVATRTWNDLPADVMYAQSLSTFRQRLRTHLFLKSFTGYFRHGFLTDIPGH